MGRGRLATRGGSTRRRPSVPRLAKPRSSEEQECGYRTQKTPLAPRAAGRSCTFATTITEAPRRQHLCVRHAGRSAGAEGGAEPRPEEGSVSCSADNCPKVQWGLATGAVLVQGAGLCSEPTVDFLLSFSLNYVIVRQSFSQTAPRRLPDASQSEHAF